MRKRYILGVTVLLLVVLAALELTGVTHFFHKKPVPVVTGSSFSAKGENKPPGNQSKDQSQNPEGSSYNSSKTNDFSAVLLAPSGNFVSNHRPNLSGSPAPNTEASVCNTTPGASCVITFTKDGAMKSLPALTADPTGFANWNWKLQDIGLSEGTWKIQAIATLNGQTKTANDAMALVVAP